MNRIALETLGCRLNQAETAILQDRFAARGYEFVTDPLDADLFVLHTCSLTRLSAAKSRRRLRWVIRRNPDACVAAIGCYAQTDAADLAAIAGVDYVVGTADKLRLADIIASPAKLRDPVVLATRPTPHAFTIDGAGRYPAHTRAHLKVQEGCDFACSFCIIPRSRGPSRSRAFGDVLREARALADAGHRELVLTGVNIGTYRDAGRTLTDLIDALSEIDPVQRVRVSSIEPTTIDESLIARMESGGKLCPYLHVPLQSGDDATLARMRRRYDADAYMRFLRDALARVPHLGLGTDVMVGFPGEDEAAFARSCAVIASLPFVNVHVFAFSARPRTRAAAMTDAVAPAVIRDRATRLRALARATQRRTFAALAGRDVEVLFESQGIDGAFEGYTPGYVRVRVTSDLPLAGRMAQVTVTGVADSAGRVVATGRMDRLPGVEEAAITQEIM